MRTGLVNVCGRVLFCAEDMIRGGRGSNTIFASVLGTHEERGHGIRLRCGSSTRRRHWCRGRSWRVREGRPSRIFCPVHLPFVRWVK